ncbi:hypothetical protein SISSUDRAFT_202561 [Sistotremastrum suecicum HHB10207 ss-3]|uniref:Uncharacterized protein n=1 Tax=Sistotremastrum suecicum HHB10207 ss-3 TaxID=1314776 RepID=A0A166GKP5_9AGAM|nr:hypothetical protein SISSUDRAFT_202561 [Sistotremastrum suecicum HHB10207 ss-3]
MAFKWLRPLVEAVYWLLLLSIALFIFGLLYQLRVLAVSFDQPTPILLTTWGLGVVLASAVVGAIALTTLHAVRHEDSPFEGPLSKLISTMIKLLNRGFTRRWKTKNVDDHVDSSNQRKQAHTFLRLIAEVNDPKSLDRIVPSLSYADWSRWGEESWELLSSAFERLRATDASLRVLATVENQIRGFAKWCRQHESSLQDQKWSSDFMPFLIERCSSLRNFPLRVFFTSFLPGNQDLAEAASMPLEECLGRVMCAYSHEGTLGERSDIVRKAFNYCQSLLEEGDPDDVTRILSRVKRPAVLGSFLQHPDKTWRYPHNLIKMIIRDHETDIICAMSPMFCGPPAGINVQNMRRLLHDTVSGLSRNAKATIELDLCLADILRAHGGSANSKYEFDLFNEIVSFCTSLLQRGKKDHVSRILTYVDRLSFLKSFIGPVAAKPAPYPHFVTLIILGHEEEMLCSMSKTFCEPPPGTNVPKMKRLIHDLINGLAQNPTFSVELDQSLAQILRVYGRDSQTAYQLEIYSNLVSYCMSLVQQGETVHIPRILKGVDRAAFLQSFIGHRETQWDIYRDLITLIIERHEASIIISMSSILNEPPPGSNMRNMRYLYCALLRGLHQNPRTGRRLGQSLAKFLQFDGQVTSKYRAGNFNDTISYCLTFCRNISETSNTPRRFSKLIFDQLDRSVLLRSLLLPLRANWVYPEALYSAVIQNHEALILQNMLHFFVDPPAEANSRSTIRVLSSLLSGIGSAGAPFETTSCVAQLLLIYDGDDEFGYKARVFREVVAFCSSTLSNNKALIESILAQVDPSTILRSLIRMPRRQWKSEFVRLLIRGREDDLFGRMSGFFADPPPRFNQAKVMHCFHTLLSNSFALGPSSASFLARILATYGIVEARAYHGRIFSRTLQYCETLQIQGKDDFLAMILEQVEPWSFLCAFIIGGWRPSKLPLFGKLVITLVRGREAQTARDLSDFVNSTIFAPSHVRQLCQLLNAFLSALDSEFRFPTEVYLLPLVAMIDSHPALLQFDGVGDAILNYFDRCEAPQLLDGDVREFLETCASPPPDSLLSEETRRRAMELLYTLSKLAETEADSDALVEDNSPRESGDGPIAVGGASEGNSSHAEFIEEHRETPVNCPG